jgi:hypothetical protein
MGKRSRRGADDASRSLAPEHDESAARAMSENARVEALARRPEPPRGESARGAPALERDPYRDEGGEA